MEVKKKKVHDIAIQRRNTAPRQMYVIRDNQPKMKRSISEPSRRISGSNDNDRASERESSLRYNLRLSSDQRSYDNNDITPDVSSFAAARDIAAKAAAAVGKGGLDYDNERLKESIDYDYGNDEDTSNLKIFGISDSHLESLSPEAKTQYMHKQLVVSEKQRRHDRLHHSEEKRKMKDEMQTITEGIQDQVRVMREDNEELRKNLHTMKRKNEKLQTRLSLVGEKNLELMELLEQRKRDEQANDDHSERRGSKDSEERQPIYMPDEIHRHSSVLSVGQPEVHHQIQTQSIQNDHPMSMDAHSMSMTNQQNERQLQPPPNFSELSMLSMNPSAHQNEMPTNPNQMLNFGQMPLPSQPPHYFYDAPPGGVVPPQLGMSNAPFPGLNNVPFPPMMFPPPFMGLGNSQFPILPQLNGELIPICVTFYGSRHIQNKLEDDDDRKFFNQFFNEVKERAYEIMTNKFGRFAFEKMLNKCNDDERTILLTKLQPTLATAACDVHGSFGTQVLVKSLTRPEQIKLVVDALRAPILKLITDYKGHYLVIVLIQKFHYEDFKWIDQVVAQDSKVIATNHQGLQVMKALLKHRTTEQILGLLEIIADQTMDLVEDQYGNYIIQEVLRKQFDTDGYPQYAETVLTFKQTILCKMSGSFRHLSKEKFSSNVVELCLKEIEFDEWKEIIIKELLAQPPVQVKDLINDRFGNYVLQTALLEAHPEQVNHISESIIPHFSCFRVNIRAKWAKLVKAARERTAE